MALKFSRLLATASLLVATLAHAGPYTSLTVFGDSLSDTGNVLIGTGGALPPAPYFAGRFTDGLNWIDGLAATLGLPLGAVPSLAPLAGGPVGASNYAFGGARTDTTGLVPNTGLQAQLVGMWAPAHPAGADPNGLYVVVGGGNDMRDARTAYQTNTAADVAARQAAALAAANNLAFVINNLALSGARHVLVATLPDLGATPEAVGLEAASTDATMRFNLALAAVVQMLEASYAGLDIDIADWFGLGQQILGNPAAYGVTNTALPCNAFTGSSNPLTACGVSMFSDNLHPSALLHTLMATSALQAIGVIPEPATISLVGAAVFGLVLVRRRRLMAA